MSERVRGSYDDALYKPTYTLLLYLESVVILLALNVIPESSTVMPASSERFLAWYVSVLRSLDTVDSLWHLSTIRIVSFSLIATPHTHDTPGPHCVQP